MTARSSPVSLTASVCHCGLLAQTSTPTPVTTAPEESAECGTSTVAGSVHEALKIPRGGLEALREERHRWQLKLERVTASHFEGKDGETRGPKAAEPAKEPDAG